MTDNKQPATLRRARRAGTADVTADNKGGYINTRKEAEIEPPAQADGHITFQLGATYPTTVAYGSLRLGVEISLPLRPGDDVHERFKEARKHAERMLDDEEDYYGVSRQDLLEGR